MTVWDGGGTDTYDFSNYTTDLVVDLQPGRLDDGVVGAARQSRQPAHTAAGNIANALLYNGNPRSLIENAIGGVGNDAITGNVGNNNLLGGAGRQRHARRRRGTDTLVGADGNDRLIGGSGDD